MNKLKYIFLFFLISLSATGQQKEDEELFDVLFVHDEVLNHLDAPIKKADRIFESLLEKVRFTKESDILILSGPKSGKKILRPYIKEKQPVKTEWKFYGLNVLQPVRKKTSSRDAFDDLQDFVKYIQFVRTDRVYIPSNQNNVKLGTETDLQMELLKWKKGYFELRSSSDSVISIFSAREEGWELFGNLRYLQVDSKQFQTELRQIYRVLKRESESKEEAFELLAGFVEINYGFYPDELIKKIVRFGN